MRKNILSILFTFNILVLTACSSDTTNENTVEKHSDSFTKLETTYNAEQYELSVAPEDAPYEHNNNYITDVADYSSTDTVSENEALKETKLNILITENAAVNKVIEQIHNDRGFISSELIEIEESTDSQLVYYGVRFDYTTDFVVVYDGTEAYAIEDEYGVYKEGE